VSDKGPDRKRATRDMFAVADANLANTRLKFQKRYTREEWDLICLGSVPESMDDKWIMFEEDGWLYMGRTDTGAINCKVQFKVDSDGATALGALLNVRAAQLDDAHINHAVRALEWLIGFWLLGRAPFTYPKGPGYVRARIELVRDPLPFIPGVTAVAYGAKDTGAMGGGTAAAILVAAGERLIPEAQKMLANTSRRVGDAVVTPSFGLTKFGIMQVCHIVSIITGTPQGDWCPYPDKLYDGVRRGLKQLALHREHTVAMSVLGTGEGRVKPADAARFMLTAIRDHQREPGNKIHVVLSLPTYEDYEAFEDFLPQL
jgi:O-acetyl-ADP-ribose deacetylase (regulator of RNase III)